MKITVKSIIGLTLILLSMSCKKKDFLDARPNISLMVPGTLKDYQALLDYDAIMNGSTSIGLTPAMGEMAADNYYVTDIDFDTRFKPIYQEVYTWSPNLFSGNDRVYDWDYPYRAIFYANLVLDGITKLSPGDYNLNDYNNTKGIALFHRAHLFYQLAQVFAPHYNASTATSTPGIPLRNTPHADEPIIRADLSTTYHTIRQELHEALVLLPEFSLYKTRPSRLAVYGLLSRVHLTMQQYDSAWFYANKYLALSNELIDYNTLNSTPTFSFQRYNIEVSFSSNIVNAEVNPIRAGRNRVDSNLYASYHADDLRKKLFFKIAGGGLTFTGSYDGSSNMFTGIATNEILLIRAETAARNNMPQAAMDDLNYLLSHRYKTGTYTPILATTGPEALQIVLEERRKELCFRGLRWTDLRRLNAEGYNIELHRNIKGNTITLLPGDKRYTFPIPPEVIAFNPSMPQNPR